MSSIAANGDMARRPADRPVAPLGRRLLSTAVLAPAAILLIVIGGWAFAALLAAGAVLLSHEWDRLTGGDGRGPVAITLGAGLSIVVLLGAAGETAAAAVAIALTAAVAAAAGLRDGRSALWTILGAIWIGLPAMSLLWLRMEPAIGLPASLWLFALVWACDSGAYVAGRSIGGPRLAPRVSPNKTWAGLLGGMAAAAAVGAVAAVWTGLAPASLLAPASAAVAALSQLGDLAESAVKRHFHVKDSGNLIPGHGGLFDRVDALLFAAPAVAALVLWHQGAASPWR